MQQVAISAYLPNDIRIYIYIGVDLVGQPGRAPPPMIQVGGQRYPFALPNRDDFF